MKNILQNNIAGKRIRTQIISLILCIVMLVILIPTSITALAAEKIAEYDNQIKNDIPEIEKEEVKNEDNLPERYIVEEIISERKADQKNFLLDDGSMLAVQYDERVHYINQDNGEWKTIDNTLIENNENSENGYINKSNDFTIKLARNSNQSKLVSLSKDKYGLSFNLLNNKNNKSKVEVYSKNNSTVKDEQISNYNDFCILKNIESGAIYESILNNVDIEYLITSTGLKENIIINSKLNEYTFKFHIKTKDLTLRLNLDGSISVLNEDNEEIFYMPIPFMYDSKGNKNNDVWYSLEQDNKDYILTIDASSSWINKVSFPVVIDPIVYTIQDTNNVISGTVANSTRSAVKSQHYLNNNEMAVGTNKYTYLLLPYRDYFHSIVKFPNLPITDPNVEIRYVAMVLNGYGTVPNFDNNYIYGYRMDIPWSRSTSLTWNNLGLSSNYPDEDFTYAKALNSASDAVFSFDITSSYLKWIKYPNECPNYGLILSGSANDGTKTSLYSERSNNAPKTPQLKVCYTYRNLGYEDYWNFETNNIRSAGQGMTNIANGNLLLINDDISLEGNRMPLSINHHYNSLKVLDYTLISAEGLFGSGWGLNIDQRLIKKAEDVYQYIDNNGTEHWIVKKGSTTIGDIDGLGLILTKEGSDYVLTDKLGNKLLFNANGRLRQIKDNNNNTLNINFYNNKISNVADGQDGLF